MSLKLKNEIQNTRPNLKMQTSKKKNEGQLSFLKSERLQFGSTSKNFCSTACGSKFPNTFKSFTTFLQTYHLKPNICYISLTININQRMHTWT